jgi:hypothetical protein
MLRRIPSAAALAVALALAGCSKSSPDLVTVEGEVLLNGQPLPNATVTFVPMIEGFGAEYMASGVSDEKGHFKVVCPGKNGAPVGENRVTVTNPSPPEGARGQSAAAQAKAAAFFASLKNRPIPRQYTTVVSTPLVINVTASQAEYRLELQR